MLFLAATMLAASPETVQTSPTGEPIEVDAKKKEKQRCQYIEVSGSRMRQRVCTDANGVTQRMPGITDAGSNPGMVHATPGAAAEGGLGGVPK